MICFALPCPSLVMFNSVPALHLPEVCLTTSIRPDSPDRCFITIPEKWGDESTASANRQSPARDIMEHCLQWQTQPKKEEHRCLSAQDWTKATQFSYRHRQKFKLGRTIGVGVKETIMMFLLGCVEWIGDHGLFVFNVNTSVVLFYLCVCFYACTWCINYINDIAERHMEVQCMWIATYPAHRNCPLFKFLAVLLLWRTECNTDCITSGLFTSVA